MAKASGVELKGMTVKVRGSAVGGWPPENEILKGPHCCTGEYAMRLKTEKELWGAKARMQRRSRKERNMAKPVEGKANLA